MSGKKDIKIKRQIVDDDFAFESQRLPLNRIEVKKEKQQIKESTELNEAVSTVSRILESVLSNCTFVESDILECVAVFLRSDKQTSDELVRVLSGGLGKLIAHENARFESIESLFYFLSKIAIKCHLNGCELPLCVIRQEVDGFSRSNNAFARCRACMLLSFVFRARSDEIDNNENEDTDNFRDSCLPSSLTIQWAALLCTRRLDKDPKVRKAALMAISDLPCRQFYDSKGNLVNSRTIILGSLRDESIIVRETAIKLAPLATFSDIDDCLQYLLQEDTISGQLLMAGKIAKSVHLDSYKNSQIETFLKFLFQSDDSSMRGLAARQLVPFWLISLKDDWDFETTFGATLCTNTDLVAYPTSLLDYLDVLKNEDVCVNLMMVSFSHFMDSALGDKEDGVGFINFLRDIDGEYRENYRIHDKDSLAETIKNCEKDLYYDLFTHRCLVQFIFNTYRFPHLSGPRDIALSRLLPTLKSLSDLLLEFLKTGEILKWSNRKFFCIRQICAMIRCLDHTCSVGRQAWREALYYMISEPSFTKCPEIVEFGVHEVLEYLVRGGAEIEEFSSWLCYSIFELIPSEGTIGEFDLFHRCGVMLNSVLHYAAIEKVDPLMKNAFIKIIKNISLSTNITHRTLGCSLIGLVCTMDDFLFQSYVHLLRHSIEIDEDEVKAAAVIAITDVIIVRGFPSVGRFSYPECSQLEEANVTEKLASCLEKSVLVSHKKYEATITENLLRLMYCTCYRWPKLIGTLLYKTYLNSKTPMSQVHVIFEEFLRHFMQRGPSAGMQLISGFLAALDIIDDKGNLRFCFGLMTTFVLSHLEVCPSKTAGFDGESEISVSLILVLLFAILERLSEHPEQMSCAYLAHTGLSMINLASVHIRYLEPLYRRVSAVYTILDECGDCEDRIRAGVQKFMNYIKKTAGDKCVLFTKAPKKEV